MTALILPFDAPHADLDTTGGKGANLARLTRAGFPVPGGFFVTVAGYRAYVDAAGLEPRIAAALASAQLNDPAALEQLSAQVRALFDARQIPAALAGEICAAYRALGGGPVAVRSSATAEDLPELSFAGQQDTYLNILGQEALLDAVARCWGSLWTARAIAYRARQQVPQHGLGLAVVVQQMVASEVSGVMFTANPLTGLRGQTVIDATLGLGEALVSGQVEPDRYTVDTLGNTLVEKKLGAKALSIRSLDGGGTQKQREDAAGRQALPDAQILALAGLGQRVAAEYGQPQDIEWALADGKLYLLQSRAITSLYPVPEGFAPEDLRAFFSFGAVQGMLDPWSPLGMDLIRLAFAGGASIFGFHYNERTVRVIQSAGERLWVDMTVLLRNPVGRKVARGAMRYVEPSVGQILEKIWDDPRLRPTDRRLKLATLGKLLRAILPVVGQLAGAMRRPEWKRDQVMGIMDASYRAYRASAERITGTPQEKLLARVRLYRQIIDVAPRIFLTAMPLIAAAMSQFTLLRRIAGQVRGLPGAPELALEVTRGVPGNVTTEMDLALWDTARAIQADAASRDLFLHTEALAVARAYHAGRLPAAAQAALGGFLARYGLRGLAEIDLGRPRWIEDCTPIVQVLGSYLQIDDPERAPDAVFARGAQAAQAAVESLAGAARTGPRGWLKARLVRFAARRTRGLMGVREAPKFYAVRLSGVVRMEMQKSGQDFAGLGLLDRPDDIFFLNTAELEALAAGEARDWKSLVAARRAAYAREARRRQVPRLLLSDGRAFYEGISAPVAAGADAIHGDPVSPGLVEGAVQVVFDPRGVQLAPGAILVCPGTDPAWTPLFLAAGGLIMEVGGLMTHGAVVAREYGIPAVVGVHQATTRLQTGDRVRLNGSTGEVEVLGRVMNIEPRMVDSRHGTQNVSE